ncbi:MAG: hypothetical protein WCG44_01855 [bacterium]
MTEKIPKYTILLPEECHDCTILARVIANLTINTHSSTIPIIIACASYTQHTVLTGNFPGREFLSFAKKPDYVDKYLIDGARISGTTITSQLYGQSVICPLNLP